MHPSKSWSKTVEPTSYDEIYKYVEDNLNEFSMFIDNIEIDYYQSSLTNKIQTVSSRPLAVVALQSWSRPLNELRDARLLHDIRNGKTIRELLAEAKEDGLYGPVSDDSLILMKRVLDKTTEQLYSKIPALADKISDCMSLMEQYFLSFYDIENIQDVIENRKKETLSDEYLETAYTYEKSRWLHMFHVNKSLKILREMFQRSEDGKGVLLSTLSKECQDLAIRCDCTSLSYIFILPECYNIARNTIDSLRKWLKEDMEYTVYIETSLKLVDEKYVEAKKAYDLIKSQFSQIEYRADSHHLQLTKLEEEDKINEKKNEDFEERLNTKEREYVSKRLTYEVYQEQIRKLIKQSNDENNAIDNRLAIERFQHDIKTFGKELPKLKNQIETIQARLQFFEQRKQELNNIRLECKKFDHELQMIIEEKILKENHYNRIKHCRDILRNIYKCRKTNDLPQKIFYDLPVKIHSHAEHEDDDLSRVSRIIAKSIGRDWNRFYWHLPFHPTRGQEELAKDIKNIDEKYQRGDVYQDQAMDALTKWRRFHTRAKVDDLVHGLEQIHRFDIVHLIERRVLKPKRLLNLEQVAIDTRTKEIEDLNRKLNRLFDKMRANPIA